MVGIVAIVGFERAEGEDSAHAVDCESTCRSAQHTRPRRAWFRTPK
jgi:hypothetical protein